MLRSRPVALCSLFFSVFVSALPDTEPTPAAYGFLLNVPEPTTEPEVQNLNARQDEGGFVASSTFALGAPSSTITTTSVPTSYYVSTVTSLGGASVCGWINGVYDDSSRVYCDYGYQCIFHTSSPDSNYPDAFGCCQDSSNPDSCAFVDNCYDVDDISATPSLTLTSGKLDAYCTASGYNYCQTFTYPEFDFLAYGCGDTAQLETVSLTGWAATTISYYEFITMAYVSASVADDSFLNAYESITATTPNVAATPGLSSASISQSTSASSPTSNRSTSKKSSTNIGAIVGGVVGGVVGLAGIGATIFMFLLLQKKKKQANPPPPEISQPALGPEYPQQPPSQPPSHHTSVIIPPQEVHGSSYHQLAEVDGYSAGMKFPSAAAAAAAGYTDSKPQEMDSKNFIAELPGGVQGDSERRPLSSDTSRPVTPDGAGRR